MNASFRRIDSGKLSVIMAAIMLAYSVTPFVTIPNRELNFQLPGFLFLLRVDYIGLVSILSAGLGATGMAWLLLSQKHEGLQRKDVQHLLIPSLTAWAIGVPLGAIDITLQWWAVFVFGGILLSLVFVSEFIIVDLNDPRASLAIIGLSAVGYVIYLVLSVAMHGAGLRLYLTLPVFFITAGLVSWRILNLRLQGTNIFHWSLATALITTQTAIGLHYLPVLPIQFGLVLTGLCYAIISFALLYEKTHEVKLCWMEPLILLVLFVGAALIFSP